MEEARLERQPKKAKAEEEKKEKSELERAKRNPALAFRIKVMGEQAAAVLGIHAPDG